MRVNSLAARLFLAAAGWSLVLLSVGAYLISDLYAQSVSRNFDDRLHLYLRSMLATAQWSDEGAIARVGELGEARFDTLYSGWYWQVTSALDPATPVAVSPSLWVERLPLPSERGVTADDEGFHEADMRGPRGEPLRVVERRVTYELSDRTYSFAVAGCRAEMDREVATFRRTVFWSLAVMGALLVLSTLFQVRYGLRPLRAISGQLADIRSGRAARLEGDFPAEITPLARELNALVASNSAVLERARTHVGNLAHALKTPLSVITNEAAAAKGPFAAKVAEQAAIMRSQIGHHLDRARMAARIGVIGVVTEVEPVLEPILRAMGKIHGGRGLSVALRCDPGLRFAGERQDFEEIAGNLIDNACKWAGSRVTVDVASAAATEAGPRLKLIVDDDGAGLSAQAREEVMRRGTRLDETKPGSGLGLSIVAELVRLYGGALVLASSPAGGLRVEVELPAV